MKRPTVLLRLLRKYDSSAFGRVGGKHRCAAGFRYLAAGCEGKAFTWGAYVVKEAKTRPFPVEECRQLGIRPPQQWFVNGWVVQPRYRRVRLSEARVNELCGAYADLGPHNVGANERGQLVAFDW